MSTAIARLDAKQRGVTPSDASSTEETVPACATARRIFPAQSGPIRAHRSGCPDGSCSAGVLPRPVSLSAAQCSRLQYAECDCRAQCYDEDEPAPTTTPEVDSYGNF